MKVGARAVMANVGILQTLDSCLRELLREVLREVLREELRPALDALRAAMTNVPQSESEILTTAEAANVAKVTVETIRSWIKSNRLHASPLPGGREYRITRQDLIRCLRTDERRADSPDIERMAQQVLEHASRPSRRREANQGGR